MWPVLAALALGVGCGGSDGGEPIDPDPSLAPPPAAQADADLDGSVATLDASTPGDASIDAGQPTDADAGATSPVDASVPDKCPADPPTSCPPGSPGYAAVKPILESRCVTCHSPRWTGPWPLDTVGHLRDWFDDVRVNLINCTMPPPDSAVKMTGEERRMLMQWVRCGMPD